MSIALPILLSRVLFNFVCDMDDASMQGEPKRDMSLVSHILKDEEDWETQMATGMVALPVPNTKSMAGAVKEPKQKSAEDSKADAIFLWYKGSAHGVPCQSASGMSGRKLRQAGAQLLGLSHEAINLLDTNGGNFVKDETPVAVSSTLAIVVTLGEAACKDVLKDDVPS